MDLWEQVACGVARLSVPGGWLYCQFYKDSRGKIYPTSLPFVFVPLPTVP